MLWLVTKEPFINSIDVINEEVVEVLALRALCTVLEKVTAATADFEFRTSKNYNTIF